MTKHVIDLPFLREPSNWQGGPTFIALHLYSKVGIMRSLMSAFLELRQVTGAFERYEDITPESVPLRTGVDNALCILHDPKTGLGPLGARFSCGEWEEDDTTYLCVSVYPKQVKRVCGDYFWDHRTTKWVTPPVIEFYTALIRMSLDLYRRKPFRIVSLHDESWGTPKGRGIAVHREMAAVAKWPVVKESGPMAIMDIEEWSAAQDS